MGILRNIFGGTTPEAVDPVDDDSLEGAILQEGHQEELERDLSNLDDGHGAAEQRAQKDAEREVQTAAEDSLKRLHVIQMGRCPQCGEHLRQHLFASICEGCGWHTFDVPKKGPVRVHLRGTDRTVDGERCYQVKTGAVLVVRNDVVVAKVPREGCELIEYLWEQGEIDQRHKQVLDRVNLGCGWCGQPTDAEKDGFHLLHIAFGSTQERYCFCSDDCYDTFRGMYPSRVHRNCYERQCVDCDLCIKRYGDETEGVRMLAKDYLTVRKKK